VRVEAVARHGGTSGRWNNGPQHLAIVAGGHDVQGAGAIDELDLRDFPFDVWTIIRQCPILSPIPDDYVATIGARAQQIAILIEVEADRVTAF